MWELSVDWFTRQIANNLYPLQKLTQTEDGEYTLDKRNTKTIATLDNNKLIKDQVPDPSTGYLTTREVREFLDTDEDGEYETMKLVLTVKDTPRATSTRIYKR